MIANPIGTSRVEDLSSTCKLQAKWFSVVDDTSVPMPGRHVLPIDIRRQAGAPEHHRLVRDHNSPSDPVMPEGQKVDLAEGNVFRTIAPCESSGSVCASPAKLAYSLDDRWKVSIQPVLSVAGLRGLFEVPNNVAILRDYESPHDVEIPENQKIHFTEGPVFKSQKRTVTIKVNNEPVILKKRCVTGLEIKESAIAQGLPIKKDFKLFKDLPDGGQGPVIKDHEEICVKDCDSFTCLTGDDNS